MCVEISCIVAEVAVIFLSHFWHTGLGHRVCHGHFLPNPFQFFIHPSLYPQHCTLWDNRQHSNTNDRNYPRKFSMHDPVFAEVSVQRINKWLELNKNIYRDKATCVSSTVTSRWQRPQLLTWPPRIRNLTQQLSDIHINKLHITSRPQTPIIFFFPSHTFFMFQKDRSCHPDVTKAGGYCSVLDCKMQL
jgi:hypothetical protein